jgi:ribonuclease III
VFREQKVIDIEDKPQKYTKPKLAFLGDNVLELIVTQYLLDSGELTPHEINNLRATIVCNNHLSHIFHNSYISTLRNEICNYFENLTPKICGNYVEGVIGAIFVDGGYEAAKQFVERVILNQLSIVQSEYDKLEIQEFIDQYSGNRRLQEASK